MSTSPNRTELRLPPARSIPGQVWGPSPPPTAPEIMCPGAMSSPSAHRALAHAPPSPRPRPGLRRCTRPWPASPPPSTSLPHSARQAFLREASWLAVLGWRPGSPAGSSVPSAAAPPEARAAPVAEAALGRCWDGSGPSTHFRTPGSSIASAWPFVTCTPYNQTATGALRPPSSHESPSELLGPGEGSAGRTDGGLGPLATGGSGRGSRVGLSPQAPGTDAHPGSFGTKLNCRTQFGENATHPPSENRSHRHKRCPPSGTAVGQGTNGTLALTSAFEKAAVFKFTSWLLDSRGRLYDWQAWGEDWLSPPPRGGTAVGVGDPISGGDASLGLRQHVASRERASKSSPSEPHWRPLPEDLFQNLLHTLLWHPASYTSYSSIRI